MVGVSRKLTTAFDLWGKRDHGCVRGGGKGANEIEEGSGGERWKKQGTVSAPNQKQVTKKEVAGPGLPSKTQGDSEGREGDGLKEGAKGRGGGVDFDNTYITAPTGGLPKTFYKHRWYT